MPTNKTFSQVSINIDLEDKVEGKDLETIDLMPQIHLNVKDAAIYDHLKIETSNTHDSLWVYTGKRRYPSVWFFVWIFGPVLLLSILTPAPFHAFASHYKDIQKLPISTCRTIGMDYNPDDLFLRVRAMYEDSQQVRRAGEFYYDMGYDLDVDNYLLDFYDRHSTFPCYYDGQSVYNTGYPEYVTSYANRVSWKATIGLVFSWVGIMILTSLFLCLPWLLHDNTTQVVSKDTFEKTGENYLEVQDWGAVDERLKQMLYSVVYNSCVQETNSQGMQAAKKNVKFIIFTKHSATSALSLFVFSLFTFIFVASLIVMFAIAFAESEHLFMVVLMWCLLSVVAIVPASLLFLIFNTIYKHPYLSATALVTPTQIGEVQETVNIFGKYYPDEKLGYLLKGTVRRA